MFFKSVSQHSIFCDICFVGIQYYFFINVNSLDWVAPFGQLNFFLLHFQYSLLKNVLPASLNGMHECLLITVTIKKMNHHKNTRNSNIICGT